MLDMTPLGWLGRKTSTQTITKNEAKGRNKFCKWRLFNCLPSQELVISLNMSKKSLCLFKAKILLLKFQGHLPYSVIVQVDSEGQCTGWSWSLRPALFIYCHISGIYLDQTISWWYLLELLACHLENWVTSCGMFLTVINVTSSHRNGYSWSCK